MRSVDLHLLRLYEALKQKLRSQPLVHGDETWVQVLKEDGRDAQAKSFMWAYRSGRDSEQPIVVFDYQPGRGQEHPQAFLGDYRGLLMSDGYNAWRTLDGAIQFGCMAHVRRKFTDALKARKKPAGPPLQALKYFEALHEVERLARETPSEGETRAGYILASAPATQPAGIGRLQDIARRPGAEGSCPKASPARRSPIRKTNGTI